MPSPEGTPRPKEHLDDRWYSRFEQAGAFQAYEYLDGDRNTRDNQKELFLNLKAGNPTLDYPRITRADLDTKERDLLELKKDILAYEQNELVRQVYRWKINEKIAEVRMLRATLDQDMDRFKAYSEFVYGKPSKEIFTYSIQTLRARATAHTTSENRDLQIASQDLLASLPDVPGDEQSYPLPTPENIATVRERTLLELSDILQSVHPKESGEQFTAEEIRIVFENALKSLETDGWKVIIADSSKSGISVDQEQKTVHIPQTRTVAFEALRTLVAHEIGTHVKRRITGERSSLKLLGLGLDRYEQGEEGVTTVRDQSLRGKVNDFAGLEKHLAISLAYGLDGNPRDFRNVYEVMQKFYYMKALEAKKTPEQALDTSQTNAWNTTVRTFRGTNCCTPGTSFTKDIIYREGNIGVWDLLSRNMAELRRLSVGKYDPTNPRHIWVLNTLGITEEDLATLQHATP